MPTDILDTVDRWQLIAREYIEGLGPDDPYRHENLSAMQPPPAEFRELTDCMMLWCGDDTFIDPAPVWDVYQHIATYYTEGRHYVWSPGRWFMLTRREGNRASRVCQRIQKLATERGDEARPQSMKRPKPEASPAGKPPLSKSERAVLEIIRALPDGEGILGPQILKELGKRGIRSVDQSHLTSRIMPMLKEHYGIANRPNVGYYEIRT